MQTESTKADLQPEEFLFRTKINVGNSWGTETEKKQLNSNTDSSA